MTEEIIISGFGGQGVLSMGKALAYSGMMQGNEVSWMPSYGPEMRGGTANVTVIISDKKVSSPILFEYDTGILLNQQSIDKFEYRIKPGGVIIYDENGIVEPPKRKDLSIFKINAVGESLKIGSSKVFNMMVMGAYIKIRPVIKLENVIKGLAESLPERYHHLLNINEAALKKGMELATNSIRKAAKEVHEAATIR
ncbi:MAG: 2-oxoglutarate ferredoxin oxidoreductase subunit gamma [Bacteroidales bacterium]|nr:2-oxoglutarate ferredoxin oxidoreductase subunit gamma [Bacteroidales bacterium]